MQNVVLVPGWNHFTKTIVRHMKTIGDIINNQISSKHRHLQFNPHLFLVQGNMFTTNHETHTWMNEKFTNYTNCTIKNLNTFSRNRCNLSTIGEGMVEGVATTYWLIDLFIFLPLTLALLITIDTNMPTKLKKVSGLENVVFHTKYLKRASQHVSPKSPPLCVVVQVGA